MSRLRHVLLLLLPLLPWCHIRRPILILPLTPTILPHPRQSQLLPKEIRRRQLILAHRVRMCHLLRLQHHLHLSPFLSIMSAPILRQNFVIGLLLLFFLSHALTWLGRGHFVCLFNFHCSCHPLPNAVHDIRCHHILPFLVTTNRAICAEREE